MNEMSLDDGFENQIAKYRKKKRNRIYDKMKLQIRK